MRYIRSSSDIEWEYGRVVCAVDQRRATAGPRERYGLSGRAEGIDHIGSVTLDDVQIGEGADELGETASRRLDFDRHGDRVPVVLHDVHHR